MLKMCAKIATVAAVSVLLIACSSHKPKGSEGPTVEGGMGADGSFNGQNGMSEQELMKRNVFYFEYDASEVKGEFVDSIRAHGRSLAKNSNARIRIEGHTDQRGSREYNIALGERRAQSVANIMISEGASREQIAIVSFGAEKPAVQGHNEEAWQYNRRAVVVAETR